jgi:hypothetical protein
MRRMESRAKPQPITLLRAAEEIYAFVAAQPTRLRQEAGHERCSAQRRRRHHVETGRHHLIKAWLILFYALLAQCARVFEREALPMAALA